MASYKRVKLKDGSVRTRVRVRVNGEYRSTTRPSKREAVRWAVQTEKELTLNRLTPRGQSEQVTFGQAADRYERLVLAWKKKGTRKQQLQQLDWWRVYLGENVALADISPLEVSDAKDALAPRAPSTINRYLSILSHLFTTAVKEWRMAEANPVEKVTRLPEPKGRTRRLSVKERGGLKFACANYSNKLLYPLVVLALSTGARKEEIRKVKRLQVDLSRQRIYLDETKNDESRALILAGEALDMVTELCEGKRPGDFLFVSPRDPRRPYDFRAGWNKVRIKARLENFCFHDLRHSTASYLAEEGASLVQIGQVLGHKTATASKRYTHLTESAVAGLVGKMNRNIKNSTQSV